MSFAAQIHKRDPNAAVLISAATLMITTKATYSNSCSTLERCFPYCKESTDRGTKQLRALNTGTLLRSHSRKELRDFSENQVPPDLAIADLELPDYYSSTERPKT